MIETSMFLVALFLCGFVIWVFFDEANPFRRREDAFLTALRGIHTAQSELLDRVMEHQQRQNEAVLGVMQALGEASQSQMSFMNRYLTAFEIDRETTRRVVTDDDEHAAWLRSTGFPVDAPADIQARWVMARATEGVNG